MKKIIHITLANNQVLTVPDEGNGVKVTEDPLHWFKIVGDNGEETLLNPEFVVSITFEPIPEKA